VTSSFVIRPEAEADIGGAYGWYEDQSPGLGEEFLASVDESLAAIRQTPQRFPTVLREPDLAVRRARLRRFPYGIYYIWDERGTGGVSIIACMHGRRDPSRWRSRT
jgi:plasmid stabilization system protein ParE